MWYNLAAIVAGFVMLSWSANRFIIGAAATAHNLNVSPLIIGLAVVGLCTSAPEMLIAAIAAMDGSPALAVGNAIGSNIANISLVLGVSALIRPLSVHSRILRRELRLLLAIMLLMLLLISDNHLGRVDGLILTGGVLLLLWLLARRVVTSRSPDPMYRELAEELPTALSTSQALFWLVIGLIILVISSRILVWGAIQTATELGVSNLTIGLTIVAIGTSLPELAASIAATLKHQHAIAIGNVVGSNMFNILAAMGIPGLIYPSVLADGVLDRDVPVLFVLTITLLLMAYRRTRQNYINRIEGAMLFACFVGYQGFLYTTELQ